MESGRGERWEIVKIGGLAIRGKRDLYSSAAVIITVSEPEPSDQTDPWKQEVYKHCQGPDTGLRCAPVSALAHPRAARMLLHLRFNCSVHFVLVLINL